MPVSKHMIALGVAGALAAAIATPTAARDRWVGPVAAGAAGFVAGAAIGAAAASGPHYDYGYAPAYGYGPGPYAYGGPAYGYGGGAVFYDNMGPRTVGGQCFVATDSGRGYGYWGPCETGVRKDSGVAAISGQYGTRVSGVPLNR